MASGSNIIRLRSADEPSADYNARLLFCFVRYLEDFREPRIASEVLAAADLSREDVLGRKPAWMSFDQFRKFLDRVRRELPEDAEFARAATHRFAEAYGPIRFALWATSPQRVFELGARTIHLVSSVSRYEIVSSGPNHIHAKYHSERPETHDMCLSRRAQTMALPTLWGLPKAQLDVLHCMAHGDPYCEWQLRYFQRPAYLPVLGGGVVGAALATLALSLSLDAPALAVSLPLAGAAIGYGWESRRTYRRNLALGQGMTDALRELAEHETEARQELTGLHQRQRDWARLMEEQVRDRTAMLHKVVDDIKTLQLDRESRLQGVSHDLRNPLAVIQSGSDLLAREFGDDPELSDLVADMQNAVDRMEKLLGQLLASASSEKNLIDVRPETVEVSPLVERLRRRLRALAHGKELRTSVFRAREAPEAIDTDPLLLDRVLDNLLTNATKYTWTGSIIVEVGGTPGYLTVKVSDTGRGIDDDQIRLIFEPEGSLPDERAPRSFGVGLSVVVHLLDQIGGRLEVMSRPGQGTTFWAHFPTEVHAPTSASGDPAFDRVVTIRQTP